MTDERLYELLPAVHRLRDERQGAPLRALMAVLQQQLSAIEADIETTWDNWFVETCEEWLVPYLGAALGVSGLRDVPATGFTLRGYVGNTLARRQRKGTAAATEQLARDVTGYPCQAVELFALTATTVHVNHLRGADTVPTTRGTVDLRSARRLLDVDGPFDSAAHGLDVRPLSDGRARHNLPNLALFLWRAQTLEISAASARPIPDADGWYRFDPLGRDIALFNLPTPEQDIAALATREHVPHPLDRLELAALPSDADPPVVVRTVVGGVETTLDVQVCHLGDVPGGLPAHRPPAGTAAVDPQLGRLVLSADDVPTGSDDDVVVDYVYGAPGRLGAGPFDRTASWEEQRAGVAITRQIGVGREGSAVDSEPFFSTLEDAVGDWNDWIGRLAPDERANAAGLIALTDSRRHAAPATTIALPDGARLAIVAGAWPVHEDDGVRSRRTGEVVANLVRPHVVGDVRVRGRRAAGAARPGGLWLNGLLVEGSVAVEPGDLEVVDLASCTVTGDPAVLVDADEVDADETAEANAALAVRLDGCVTGTVRSTAPIGTLTAARSVLRSPDRAIDLPGCAIDLDGCTVVGGIRGRTLDASNAILDNGPRAPRDALEIEVLQDGCLRYSYVPFGAVTPRRFRCQPDRALEGVTAPDARRRIISQVRPAYDGEDLGDAGLFLLAASCPAALSTAASDGSEPGVWHHLHHATRMANLRAALREYLRFGLEAGAVFDR